MKLNTARRRFALKRTYPWLAGGVAVAASGGLLTQYALAAAPAAGTQIKAQATAAYLDGTGASQTSYSNEVITIVQQVGAFTVSPAAGGTKSAAAGGSVSVPYTITNTGNGSDNFTVNLAELAGGNAFSRIDVFADVDGNGVADNTTSLLGAGAIVTDGGTGSTAAITLPAGSSYSFVVTYTVPSVATGAWSNTADVSVTAANGAIGYAALTQSRTDTVSLATGSSFNVVGSIGAPGVAAAGGGGWGATPSSGPWGTSTTYTINYQNSGAAAGSVYIKMPVPSGFTYQSGTAVWSNNGGVALGETAGANVGIDYVVSGSNIEAVIPNVPVNGSGTVSFKVSVNTLAALGTSTTSPSVSYSLQNCGSVTTVAAAGANGTSCGSPISAVAATPFDVTATYGVQLGGADDLVDGTPNGAADTYTQAKIVAGGSVKFTIPVTNNGNLTEAFKLSTAASGGTPFPAGSTYTWFAANGVTPLVNTTGSGGVDTGPLAPGASTNVVLQVTVPVVPVASAVNYETKVLAASANDNTEVDAALVRVTDVIGGYIELTTDGTNGLGPNTTTVSDSITVTAGGTGNASVASPNTAAGSAVFALQVANNDSGPLTFDLRASQTAGFPGNLPAGWTVSYHTDAAAASAPVSQVSVAAGGSQTVYAKVTPAGGHPTGAVDVFFQAVSTTVAAETGAIVSDSLRDQVVVQAASAYSFTLSGGGSAQVTAPGSVDFAHNVQNNGGNTCGDPVNGLSFTASLDATSQAAGWQTALYLDSTSAGTIGQIDAADTLITDNKLSAIVPGANVPVLVRVFAPGGAIPGTAATVTVTVTDLKSGQNCGSQSSLDTASIVTGQMSVLKTQLVDSTCANTGEPSSAATLPVKPGQCVVYKVVATNIGANTARNVSITDVVPAYTVMAANQPANQCVATNATGSPSYSVTAPTVGCGTAATLAPNGTLILRYAVQVSN